MLQNSIQLIKLINIVCTAGMHELKCNKHQLKFLIKELCCWRFFKISVGDVDICQMSKVFTSSLFSGN